MLAQRAAVCKCFFEFLRYFFPDSQRMKFVALSYSFSGALTPFCLPSSMHLSSQAMLRARLRMVWSPSASPDGLAGSLAEGVVPVGGGDDGHLADGEVLVQHVEARSPCRRGGRMATAAAGLVPAQRRARRRKAGRESVMTEPVGGGIVDRRADDQAVCRASSLAAELVHAVVYDAAWPSLAQAPQARQPRDAAWSRCRRAPYLFRTRSRVLRAFRQARDAGVALRAGTAVQKQLLSFTVPSLSVISMHDGGVVGVVKAYVQRLHALHVHVG